MKDLFFHKASSDATPKGGVSHFHRMHVEYRLSLWSPFILKKRDKNFGSLLRFLWHNSSRGVGVSHYSLVGMEDLTLCLAFAVIYENWATNFSVMLTRIENFWFCLIYFCYQSAFFSWFLIKDSKFLFTCFFHFFVLSANVGISGLLASSALSLRKWEKKKELYHYVISWDSIILASLFSSLCFSLLNFVLFIVSWIFSCI